MWEGARVWDGNAHVIVTRVLSPAYVEVQHPTIWLQDLGYDGKVLPRPVSLRSVARADSLSIRA